MTRMYQGANSEAVVDVWIDIRSDLLPGSSRGLESCNRQIHLAPVGTPSGLEMKNMNRGVRGFSDTQGLVNGFEQLIAFVAHVRVVSSAIGTGDFGQFRDLFFRRIDGGRIDKRSRK